MVVASIGKVKIASSNHKYVNSRNIKNLNFVEFCDELRNESWEDVLSVQDTNIAYDVMVSRYTKILDKFAPMRRKRVRQKSAPWMNTDIKSLMQERDKSKKKALKSKDPSDWNNYKHLKNQVTSLIRKSKRKYINDNIIRNRGNSSELWKLLHTLLPKKRANVLNRVKSEGRVITNYKEIANVINNSFVDVPKRLRANLPKVTYSDCGRFIDHVTSTFSFTPVTESEIMKCFDSIPRNKAAGLDNLPTSVLKDTLPLIMKPLCHVLNLSLAQGTIPDAWKLARVSPIFKGGDQTDPQNYRPISVLSVLSKVLERLVFNQLYNYLKENNLLSDSQFGFRPNFSTCLALITITEHIRKALDEGCAVGFITLDLKKAFDLIPHDVIIEKLRKYGVSPETLVWFKNYLSGRKQVTVINGNMSEPRQVSCGVPQGSILGPLLFIITINDIVKTIQHCNASLYADDTCLYYASSNHVTLEKCVNEDLKAISKWLEINGLLLNEKKCECMIIAPKHKKQDFSNIHIKLNGCSIQQKNVCKYLGVMLNDTLTWNDHVAYVRGKLSSSLYCFKRIRPFISQNTALTLYKGLIQPHLDYCSIVWRNAGKTLCNQISVLQKRALRATILVGNRFSSEALYQLTSVEPIENRWKKQAAVFIFKLVNGLLPKFMCQRISVKDGYYHLRNSRNILKLNKPRTNFIKYGCIYSSALIFNNLPENIRVIDNLSSFKTTLHNHIL